MIIGWLSRYIDKLGDRRKSIVSVKLYEGIGIAEAKRKVYRSK